MNHLCPHRVRYCASCVSSLHLQAHVSALIFLCCLASHPYQMIFEIRDLKFATPATATRAGILYISEGRQWSNMVSSWLDRVAKPYAEKAKWKVSGHSCKQSAALVQEWSAGGNGRRLHYVRVTQQPTSSTTMHGLDW